jgi:hypothetical protein
MAVSGRWFTGLDEAFGKPRRFGQIGRQGRIVTEKWQKRRALAQGLT